MKILDKIKDIWYSNIAVVETVNDVPICLACKNELKKRIRWTTRPEVIKVTTDQIVGGSLGSTMGVEYWDGTYGFRGEGLFCNMTCGYNYGARLGKIVLRRTDLRDRL